MPTKSQIIGELGQAALLLPELIGRALAANDRVKLCFTLLQAAQSHADQPEQPTPPLLAGQAIAGLSTADVERSIVESCRQPDGSLHISGAEQLRGMIFEDNRHSFLSVVLQIPVEVFNLTNKRVFRRERAPYSGFS